MNGKLRIGKVSTAAAVAAAMLVPLGATPARAATPSLFTCTYIVFGTSSTAFWADLKIQNNGPVIYSWTARWTFDVPTTNILAWAADMSQSDTIHAIAKDQGWNGTIQTSTTQTFGWSATALSTRTPTDITVNGVAC